MSENRGKLFSAQTSRQIFGEELIILRTAEIRVRNTEVGADAESETTSDILAWADSLLDLTDPMTEKAKEDHGTETDSTGKSSPRIARYGDTSREPELTDGSKKTQVPWLLPPKTDDEDVQVNCPDSGSAILDQAARIPFPRIMLGRKLMRVDHTKSGNETISSDSIDHNLDWSKTISYFFAGQAVSSFVRIVQKQVGQTSTLKEEKWSKKVQSYKFLGDAGNAKLNKWKEMIEKK